MKSYNNEYQSWMKDWFSESKLYLNKSVENEFTKLGLYDSSYKNDVCPSYLFEIRDNVSIRIHLANSENDDFENEEYNTSIIHYVNEYDDIYDYIFESKDIWIIWSIIKSNIDYFKSL